jgi:hypothetical protein
MRYHNTMMLVDCGDSRMTHLVPNLFLQTDDFSIDYDILGKARAIFSAYADQTRTSAAIQSFDRIVLIVI